MHALRLSRLLLVCRNIDKIIIDHLLEIYSVHGGFENGTHFWVAGKCCH